MPTEVSHPPSAAATTWPRPAAPPPSAAKPGIRPTPPPLPAKFPKWLAGEFAVPAVSCELLGPTARQAMPQRPSLRTATASKTVPRSARRVWLAPFVHRWTSSRSVNHAARGHGVHYYAVVNNRLHSVAKRFRNDHYDSQIDA